jgi:phospholipid/cholesterol/gamma-HCH transport system substrate-binding protein
LNPQTNYVAVGLFLIGGVVSLVVLIMWLGKAGDTEPKASYVVEIDGNVNGLSNGSIVRYLGVNVGQVVDIVLHTEGHPVVDVYIQIQKGLPIGEHTYATLVAQGVTGIANIDLANDPNADWPPVVHDTGVPVIPFRASGLNALLTGTGDITEEFLRVLARINDLVGDENRARAGEILENVRLVSETLASERDDIPTVMASLKRSLASLERTAKALEGAVSDDWPGISTDLKTAASNLADASARVDSLLARNDASLNELLGKGFEDMTALAGDLRTATQELTRLSARLREDPSRLIYRPQEDPVVAEP